MGGGEEAGQHGPERSTRKSRGLHGTSGHDPIWDCVAAVWSLEISDSLRAVSNADS